MEMIDLMMNAEQDVTLVLERLTGGPLDEFDADDLPVEAFFAMAGTPPVVELGQHAQR
jgi:hypothetical protein